MIELALIVAAGSLVSGLALAFLLRRAPTVRAQLAGLALIAVCVPLAAVLLSGWVMFHMGADVKILAVAAGSATAAVFAALVLARSITGSLGRVGTARSARWPAGAVGAGSRGWRSRDRGARRLVQRDGRGTRAALRRPARARGLGEPRPPRPDRVAAGDARGDRGWARLGRGLPADAPRTGADALGARRRPVRAGANRRGRAHARAAPHAGRPARRLRPAPAPPGSRRARRRAERRRRRGASRRGWRPTSSSASSSIS